MPKIAAEVNDRDYQRLLKRKQLDGFADRSMDEYLSWTVRDVELDAGLSREIQRGTKSELAPMWMKNLAQNLPRIRKSAQTLRNLVPLDLVDEKCVVIGRGPSVFGGGNWWNRDHLSLIYESDAYQNDELTVIVCDGILKDCLKAGIIPDYVTAVDGSPVIKKWFDGLSPRDITLYEETGESTRAVISTQINPEVADMIHAAGFDVYWFQPATDDVNAAHSVTRSLMLLTCWEGNPNGVVSIDCGGQVGTMSWVFSWTILRHRNVCLVGMTCGYPKGMPKDETYYWDTALSSIPALHASVYYKDFYNPDTGETYYTDPVFDTYREAFLDMALRKPDWLRLFNASSGTLYFPPHIESVELERWLRE